MTRNFRTNHTSSEGIRLMVSEKVAMGMLSVLLSALSFYGGYTYGTRKANSAPVQSIKVEEIESR